MIYLLEIITIENYFIGAKWYSIIHMDLKERFYKVYNNLPLGLREEVILVSPSGMVETPRLQAKYVLTLV